MSNKKPHLFNFATLSDERKHALKTNGGGFYAYSFKNLDADALNRFSLGFNPRTLDLLARRPVVLFETFYSEGVLRLNPIPEQFTAKQRKLLKNGSFNGGLISRYAGLAIGLNSALDYGFICLDCGRCFLHEWDATAHRCDAPRCPICGHELHSPDEKKAGFCADCALSQCSTFYGYHERPNRSKPLFEKPRARSYLLHIGAEIEVDGSDDFDPHENAREFSNIFNHNPFKPFAHFERDGSLCDGVEVITAPLTFNGFIKKSAQFMDFYTTAYDNGGHFDRYNGLHFHLDKKYFDSPDDPDALTRASVLLDYMVYKYFDFFATISHRERDRFEYARDKHRAKSVLGASMDFYNQSHSNAVNQQNSNTIEIRIFGGYIDSAKAFFGALDIVNALAKWAKYATLATAEKATPASLVKYITNPARVLDFVNFATPNGYHTTAGDALKNDFIKALNNRINGGKN